MGQAQETWTFPQRLSAGCPRIPRSRSLWHHHLFHRQRPCRLVVYSQEYKWIGLYGRVCLKSSSTTRSTIALSSGESEFYSIVKAASAGLGLRAMYSCPKRCAIRFVWYVFKEGSRQVETQSEGFYGYSVQQQVKNKVTDLRAVSTHVNLSDVCPQRHMKAKCKKDDLRLRSTRCEDPLNNSDSESSVLLLRRALPRVVLVWLKKTSAARCPRV